MESETILENTEQYTYIETSEGSGNVTLETIHEDLGYICSFLVIASVLIFMLILYKILNLFF